MRAGEARNDPYREKRLFSAVLGAIDRFATISGENGLASDFELLL